MNNEQIKNIENTFNLTKNDLAKALGVAPVTVGRWESGENEPAGLQAEVLQGLHNVALDVKRKNDAQQTEFLKGLILLGIGALIFYLLIKK
jgi:transcriptional regulator with XRE-family HTH domain